MIVGPNAVFKAAPNPNAARLFQCFCFSPECQQLVVDFGGMRSFHRQVAEKPGRQPLAGTKVMKEDPAAVEKMSEEIKAHYTKIFKV
jgi:iron(III) transport system substrate-binding protein